MPASTGYSFFISSPCTFDATNSYRYLAIDDITFKNGASILSGATGTMSTNLGFSYAFSSCIDNNIGTMCQTATNDPYPTISALLQY